MTSSCRTDSQTAITKKELIMNSTATTMATEGKRLVSLLSNYIVNSFDNDDDDGLVVGFVILFPRLSEYYEYYRAMYAQI